MLQVWEFSGELESKLRATREEVETGGGVGVTRGLLGGGGAGDATCGESFYDLWSCKESGSCLACTLPIPLCATSGQSSRAACRTLRRKRMWPTLQSCRGWAGWLEACRGGSSLDMDANTDIKIALWCVFPLGQSSYTHTHAEREVKHSTLTHTHTHCHSHTLSARVCVDNKKLTSEMVNNAKPK